MEQGKEAGYEVREYLRVIRKRIWLLIVIFVPTVTGVAIASYKMTPVYQATAFLQIEKKQPNIVGIQDVYQMDVRPDDYYQTQYRLITSRRVCKAVFDRFSLALSERYAHGKDQVGSFISDIIVKPIRDTYLVNVSYESEDPRLAAKVANAVSDEYIATVRRQKKTVSDEAENKIVEQIPVLREKLIESQSSLQKFEEENSALSFQKRREVIYGNLLLLNAQFTKVAQEVAGAKAQCKSVDKAGTLEDLLSLPEIVNSLTIQSYSDRKLALETEKAELAQKYKPNSDVIKAIDSQIKVVAEKIQSEIDSIVESVRKQLEQRNSESEELQALIYKQEELAKSVDAKMSRYDSLRAEVEGNRKLYDEFVQRQKELQSSSQFDLGTVQIIDRAEVLTTPVRPKKGLYILLAGVFSILGGIGLAFLLEHLDDTIKTHEDVEKYISLPVLGVVPSVKADKKNTEYVDLLAHREPKSNISEAYRSIRTSLLYSSLNQAEPKAYVIISAGPREGKTTVAINLAITLAHAGKRVLLVDSDLRRPRIHKTFKTDGANGLTNCLVGQGSARECVAQTEIENLYIMPSGPIPPNPAELLGSAKMKEFVAEMKKDFDAVILDSPPLVAVTDGAVLAAIADGALQVIWAGSTSRKLIGAGKESVESIGAKVVGVILNNLRASGSSYYYYRYPRYYEHYGAQEKESSTESVS
jgi:capsular exopolysaccharide synthesis family protein